MGMNRLLAYFQNLRFKQKLISSYLVVSIIPVLVLGAFSYMQANELLLRQAKQNLDNSVRQAAESITNRTRQYEAVINSITQNIVFKQIFKTDTSNFPGLYRDYVDPFFGNVLDFNPDILQMSVFTDRAELFRGEYILPLKLTDDVQWAQQSILPETRWTGHNGKFFAIRPFDTVSGSASARPPALLFLSLDGDQLFRGLDDIQSDYYGVMIMEQSGETVLSRSSNMTAGPEVLGSEARDLQEGSGFFRTGGEELAYVKSSIGNTGWQVFYYTPKSHLSVDVKSIVKATTLIVAVCFLILLFVINMFSSTFVKRITHLNKTMMMVENGNLNVSITSHSADEIGQLTNRFNRMLTNINTLIEEVYQSKIIQKEAELKALQTQINPHFLYNTLSIINWKALEIDAMEISRITTTVSKFYRTVLNKGRNTISIRNELENAKAYMEIQLVMHNNSFDFECRVEEALLQYDMLNLIFQPILENALEHGIDRLRKGQRRGRIELTGRMVDGTLEFVIRDNGPGMEEETAARLLEANARGYGLKNVHDRISLLFGSSYGLRVQSVSGEGTAIKVLFPPYILPASQD